jgi:hypothetical protein
MGRLVLRFVPLLLFMLTACASHETVQGGATGEGGRAHVKIGIPF